MKKQKIKTLQHFAKSDPASKFFLKYCSSFVYDKFYVLIQEKSIAQFYSLSLSQIQSISFIQKLQILRRLSQIILFLNLHHFSICWISLSQVHFVTTEGSFELEAKNVRLSIKHHVNLENKEERCY